MVKAEVSFMAADATSMPFSDNAFDAVFLFGVLHHLPKPDDTCKEISRVLTPEGTYFGMENNYTILRGIFDILQNLFPLWKEEAGPEAQISQETLKSWLSPAGMNLQSFTHVFVPPHIVNIFTDATARKLLDLSDALGMRLPILKDNGGLITFVSRKIQGA
jgi:ubiquinone/menaquinone biosynthesis C-methylase UbiE